MNAINIDIIINVNAACAICHLLYGTTGVSRRMYEQKDLLKMKSHLKTQQFSIVDSAAFDLPLYRRGGRFRA